MKKSYVIFKFAGAAAIPVYILFTVISHLFNTAITPASNWLSDYGNPTLNPEGALFYNMGCIITAVLLAIFYTGMSYWYAGRIVSRKYKVCYICAQVCGLISSVFLVLASIFTLGTNDSLHGTFSMLHMISLNFFMNFTALAILLHPNIKSIFGIIGFIAVIFNILTTNMFSGFYIAEWIYFLLFIAYIVIITVKYEVLGDGHRPTRYRHGDCCQ